MADAEGPGKHRPRVCVTRNTFADLGDTRGFRDPGELQVYGLELTKEGFYKRTPIAVPEAQPVEPDWEVKLELRMLNMDIEHRPASRPDDKDTLQEGDQKLVRLANAGKMLVFYGPSGPNQPDITGYVNFYACFTKSDAVARLKAHTTFAKDLEILKKPPAGSTIYLELVLGAVIPTDWVEVLPGLTIKWRLPRVVGLIITNPGGKTTVRATVPDVETKVESAKVSLAFIQCGPNFQFVRLLFSMAPVSDSYGDHLTAEIGRREVLLKTLTN